jgi:predicted nucleotide-binding protein (sugar kinase/HSP70/actin superfamily)
MKPHKVQFDNLIAPGPPLKDVVGTYPGIGVMSELVDGVDEVVDFKGRLIRPKPNGVSTLDLGTQFAPEGACLPFKLIMGNVMESLNRGANTVGMITENGPCRLGFYSLGMRLIFSDLGLGNGWLEFDNASVSRGYIKYFKDAYRETHGKRLSVWKVGQGFLVGFSRITAVEKLQEERNRLLAYEREAGSIKAAYEEGLALIRAEHSPLAMRGAVRKAMQKLHAVPIDRSRDTVRVAITGEVYCVVDPFANSDVEMRLARLGAEPLRVIWQVNYLRHKLHLDHFRKISHGRAVRAAKQYMGEDIGGDCNSNIGHAILAHQRGDDGMVHVKPFGCMLEFVSENLLQKVEEDLDFPILSLTLDDLSGEERINVRLQAFVDNLFRRKHNRRKGRG